MHAWKQPRIMGSFWRGEANRWRKEDGWLHTMTLPHCHSGAVMGFLQDGPSLHVLCSDAPPPPTSPLQGSGVMHKLSSQVVGTCLPSGQVKVRHVQSGDGNLPALRPGQGEICPARWSGPACPPARSR